MKSQGAVETKIKKGFFLLVIPCWLDAYVSKLVNIKCACTWAMVSPDGKSPYHPSIDQKRLGYWSNLWLV